MSTFADSTRLSTLPSANADRARAAPGGRHTRFAGRHVAAVRVAEPLRHRNRARRASRFVMVGAGRPSTICFSFPAPQKLVDGRPAPTMTGEGAPPGAVGRARDGKGAPASPPAPPLPHCAKYGIERVPSQGGFSFLDHFWRFPVFRPLLPRHARNKSIAVRFNFAGPGVWLGYPRVSGASVRSRLGLRDARTARSCPLLSPRTCSGVQTVKRRSRPVSPDRGPGQAWTPDQVRGDSGGAETVPFVGTEPVPKLNRTAVEQVRA